MKTGGLYIDADGVSVPVAHNIRAAPHGVQVKAGATWVPEKPAGPGARFGPNGVDPGRSVNGVDPGSSVNGPQGPDGIRGPDGVRCDD
jgi:hypothetical protein